MKSDLQAGKCIIRILPGAVRNDPLGMQIKEIAATRNVTEGAQQQARERLRKMLDVPQGESLSRFLPEV